MIICYGWTGRKTDSRADFITTIAVDGDLLSKGVNTLMGVVPPAPHPRALGGQSNPNVRKCKDPYKSSTMLNKETYSRLYTDCI